MRAWLEALAPRERLAVVLGAAALACVLVYAVLWQPFAARHARLAQVVAEQRALLAWAEQAARTIEGIRQRGATPGAGMAEGQSLLTLVDATTRSAGVAPQVTRVQPEGQDVVRVWLDRVSFNQLALWLARLEGDAGVEAESVTVEPTDRPGQVNVRLGLRRPGGPS